MVMISKKMHTNALRRVEQMLDEIRKIFHKVERQLGIDEESIHKKRV